MPTTRISAPAKDGTLNALLVEGPQDRASSFSTFDADYAAEWYGLAAKSGKGAITAALSREATTDVHDSMTSIAYPVMSNGKLIGVSGVDISLDVACRQGSQATSVPSAPAASTLLSQSGKWLVAPIPDLLMKDYDGERRRCGEERACRAARRA